MTTIWLTYAWADNETGDVDYAAQELAEVGLDVKLDRWNLQAGERLWPQIEAFIQDPALTLGLYTLPKIVWAVKRAKKSLLMPSTEHFTPVTKNSLSLASFLGRWSVH